MLLTMAGSLIGVLAMHSRDDSHYLFGIEFYTYAPPQEATAPVLTTAKVTHVVLRVSSWEAVEESVARITEGLLHLPHLKSVVVEALKRDDGVLDAKFWPPQLYSRVVWKTWKKSLEFAQSVAAARANLGEASRAVIASEDRCPPSPIWTYDEYVDIRKRM